jgi:hypothetical protein
MALEKWERWCLARLGIGQRPGGMGASALHRAAADLGLSF